MERFSVQGVERDFFKDGQKIAKVIPRLNGWQSAQNWLSMQPGAQCYSKAADFGEFNEENRLHGRGITIYDTRTIEIGYFGENGWLTTGNWI